MPIKGTKLLEASKITTVISAYTTALPVAPASGHVSVFVDLALTDQHREVEVIERLRNLMEYAREDNYAREVATTRYYRMPINGAKNSIVSTTTSTSIAVGMVAIGVNTAVISGNYGSLIIDACFKEVIDWMREQASITGLELVAFDGDNVVTMDGERTVW